jgi:NDP-sugar pyrophosphorylase family protein
METLMAPAPRLAVILAGGLGTRLRPLTLHTPKALLPVVNRPLISYELEWLRRAGVERVILSVAEQAEALEAGLGHQWQGLELIYRREPQPLDTAGALKFAAGDLAETFWALNGDLIFDFDPAPMVAEHRERQALLSIALRQVADVAPFGLIHRDASGQVTAFLEKVAADPTGQNTVNAGIYLLEPAALAPVPLGEAYSNERQLFPGLVAAGERVLGYLPANLDYWADVGRLETYLRANHDLLAGALPWPVAETAPPAAVPAGMVLAPCAIAEAVTIEPGSEVGPFVSVGAGARIAAGARVTESIIHPCAALEAGVNLSQVVVAAGQVVPAGHRQQGGIIDHVR